MKPSRNWRAYMIFEFTKFEEISLRTRGSNYFWKSIKKIISSKVLVQIFWKFNTIWLNTRAMFSTSQNPPPTTTPKTLVPLWLKYILEIVKKLLWNPYQTNAINSLQTNSKMSFKNIWLNGKSLIFKWKTYELNKA